MPTYEYACRDCGHHLEVVQSFRDERLTECTRCSGALRKVFSPAGIIFKGSGYYVTDTRAEQANLKNGSSAEASSDGASSSDGAAGSGEAAGSGDAGSSTSDASSSKGDSGSSGARDQGSSESAA